MCACHSLYTCSMMNMNILREPGNGLVARSVVACGVSVESGGDGLHLIWWVLDGFGTHEARVNPATSKPLSISAFFRSRKRMVGDGWSMLESYLISMNDRKKTKTSFWEARVFKRGL